jgi:hypothetical protein
LLNLIRFLNFCETKEYFNKKSKIMKLKVTILLAVLMLFFLMPSIAQQDQPVYPSIVGSGVFLGETSPLRDMPVLTQAEIDQLAYERGEKKKLNEKLAFRSYPFASTALPKGPDPVRQSVMGTNGGITPMSNAPIQNFSGQTSPYDPPDCNGTAGPSHYMQTINTVYAIYSKTGTLLAGPSNMNTLFSGVTGSGCNDGDPLVLYDEMAQRWLAVEFSICGANDYMLVAVSTTSDPTGTWYKYSFDVADMPDYEKFGIWPDGYYMGTNNSSGNDIYVFQRSVMLTGGASPQMIGFNNPYRPTSIDGFMCVPPVDNDGTAAPTGAPGTFIAFNDDAIGGGSDQLWICELAADWTTPASSTFTRVQQIAVSPFDSNFGNNWTNIVQPGTTQKLDAIPQVVMNVPQYRNFGTYQTLVCCHTVDVDATDHAGVRWYELRRGTQTSGNWSIRQQGTYAPDAHSRWMGSIMLNGSGKIALGYSISSSTVYPGIRYTGQSSAAYNAGLGVMDITEQTIQTGSFSQTSSERWGDYSLMAVDPVDDQTFWFTTEYVGSGSTHPTKIASFKFGNDPTVVTLAATSVTSTGATLNGTINPNSLAISDYHFEYGLTTSYGTNTTAGTLPAGSTAVAVNASISGLTAGLTYHFRLVATNSDGTGYGSDMTFVPGGASVTTTAATSITTSSATSGGNVITDGGSAVTARGVCWSTAANPTIAGNHTTDGSGTGTFTSSITGLTSNTTYHIRAYATNGNGTFYGDDLTFTTLCGVVTTFPWSEGFENGGVIPSCWSQEYVTTPNLDWTFITGNGGSYPATAHGGTYNACLKDATAADNKTKLVTPPLNLSGLSGTTLTFYHYMRVWGADQDQLLVYYKTSAAGAWTLLTSYTASVTAWTLRTISLPSPSSEYYIAFEGNAKYGYGVCIDDVSVTGTLSVPTVTTTTPTAITSTTATSGGNVTSQGGSAVTARGVCWSTAANPTITDSHTSDGTGTGAFTSSITGLTPGTLYHVRAYATNSSGTAYGSDLQFTTTAVAPTVTTATPTSITASTAVSGGNVTSDGGSAVTARGVCWSTGINPTLLNSYTTDGTGTGTFTSNISGLTASTLYHVRAYATNSIGTSYGSDLQFTTASLPTLSVTPSNQDVTSVAGNTSFSVTSNATWNASSDQGWCTVTPSGTGNGTISASYTENTSVSSRIASITVTVTGLSPIIVTVTQAGAAPTLGVTPSNQNVTSAAGSTSFSVTSNTTWAASSDQGWCTVTPSGTGNGTITANYTQNITYVTRIANVTVTVTGLSPVIVTVTQAGATPPDFSYTIANDVQVSETAFEFDLLLLDNTPATPFELATVQAGIFMNPAIYNSGTVTATILPGTSTLNASQQPTSIQITQSANIIKLAAKAPPGAGNGSILSTNPASPTRICRLRISNTVPWATAQPNLTFNFATSPYPTKISQYIGGINTAMTVNSTNCYSVCANNLLNPPATLSVTPNDQTVTAAAGSTAFTVTSNRTWNVVSDQSWCTVTSTGYGNGSIVADYTENTSSSTRVANITVTVAGLSPVVVTVTQNGVANKTLNLLVFLEGLYDAGGVMRPAMDESGPHWGATIADKITIELHSSSSYSTLIYTLSNVDLMTDGTATVTVPSAYNGSYYLTIRHRNSIETVSAAPVSFAGTTISYQFDSDSKAYGNNMKFKGGLWVIYGGDANQDGLVDSGDMIIIDNDASTFATGYLVSDINGDGLIDSGDMIILDNNASAFIAVVLP